MAIVWNDFVYDKEYFVDATKGDDSSGDGAAKPYKTLSKLLTVIPKDKNSLIKLRAGEYTFGQDLSDGFANCRVTIIGNQSRTTLKQMEGFYSDIPDGGGNSTFTLEFAQLLFKIDADLTKSNLNYFHFNWNMYNVVITDTPDNGYSVFLPHSSLLKMLNCIKLSSSLNLLRTTHGAIELTNCYGAFTSGYSTNDSSWNKSNNIITMTPIYDSNYIISFDGIGVYSGKLAWRKNGFLVHSSSGNYLAFQNKIDAATVIPKMASNTSPIGRAFAKDIYSAPYDAWKAFNQIDDNDGYCSQNGSAGVGFLGYEFAQDIPISKYAVRSMNSSSALYTLPKNWTFEGSKDGAEWEVLDTQKNQTWTAINTDKDYCIVNPKSYKMYRLNWTSNNGHTGYTGLNELKMYSGTNEVSQIPSINEKYFTAYGMNKITQQTLKSDYDRVRLISNRESKRNEGKTFEHEIDFKKYEVNKIKLS
ncbi:discoidin/SUN/FTP domain-containing protein [Paenibacillus apiarius]|uniref:SUN domain-containing protein n=1 Tax=Paenibacillus apiarius TaxID=46240 RepID=A0ABT4DPC0_9BACL|nr:hypothetical protein [Paenibacillus apiarius]MCY9517204.1 SUN domain-containing protein [Paenibacillus apiarius]MCY9519201.1 SUN domain-containing protein [Paenibacillus apiarius]MCY9555129.1 SUN domain-containing protein [Paenibacillus apiarius]MCY9560003.1 SUN domain-containing protein [Paenibacillus apiarius]MCY9683354.1 SUN domain-containing protein [Paenibacillus apiarius]